MRAYHKMFYRPENLCVIVTGQIDPGEVCRVLSRFEAEHVIPPQVRVNL